MINKNKFINYKNINLEKTIFENKNKLKYHYYKENNKNILYVEQLISPDNVRKINNIIDKQEWIPVGLDGIQKNHKKNDPVGSYRLSLYSEEIAGTLFKTIKTLLPLEYINDYSYIEGNSGEFWKPVGVNPLLRFIKYKKGGRLIPHYDASFSLNKNKKTIKSFIIYLTDNSDGNTRFLIDEQDLLKRKKRNYEDQKRIPNTKEIYKKITPKKGSAILFSHRILHDSEPCSETKIIIRTDIFYEKI